MNLHTKGDISTSNRSRDMEGVPKFQSRSRDPFPTPFDLILHFFR